MPELTQEQYDELIKQIRILKFQQQKANDLLRGGLTSRNLASFRNTYVINAQDSLDADYPMYVHFNIIKEMIKIVSVKVSFWILNYRAYSTAKSNINNQDHYHHIGFIDSAVGNPVTFNGTNLYCSGQPGYAITGNPSVGHTHDINYGIFEEETSPIIKFYISENEGVSYNYTFFGGYDVNKKDLEITSLLTGAGSKLIKFTSDVRARLSVQIEIKVDIKAR